MRRPPDFKLYISDTSSTHKITTELDYGIKMAKLLNLPFIFSGVDSFELRIWHWEFAGGSSLITLRYAESHWNASKTVYFEHSNQIDSSIMYRIYIQEDIGKLVKYLSSDSILDLPTQKAIPGIGRRPSRSFS